MISAGPCIIGLAVSSSPFLVNRSWGLYGTWVVTCCLVFSKPLLALTRYSLGSEDASHILLIPFIVAWLIYLDRHKIVPRTLDIAAAAWFAVPAVVLSTFAVRRSFVDTSLSLSALILALVLLLVAGFVAVFGRNTAMTVYFALAFLVLLVPLPEPLLNQVVYLLQAGSAAVAEILFDWTRVPVLREGFIFHLPRMSIEVARECSGIRSSVALLILALLVAHFSFSKFWKKAVFVCIGLLMMIVKNGIRIAMLTLLANYVDPTFLYGRLHRDGGIIFFLIGLVLLWPIYWWLRRGEQSSAPSLPKTSLT